MSKLRCWSCQILFSEGFIWNTWWSLSWSEMWRSQSHLQAIVGRECSTITPSHGWHLGWRTSMGTSSTSCSIPAPNSRYMFLHSLKGYSFFSTRLYLMVSRVLSISDFTLALFFSARSRLRQYVWLNTKAIFRLVCGPENVSKISGLGFAASELRCGLHHTGGRNNLLHDWLSLSQYFLGKACCGLGRRQNAFLMCGVMDTFKLKWLR